MPVAERLNQSCQCVWVDPERLAIPALNKMFSRFPVFVSQADEQTMRDAVAELDRTLRSPRFADAAIADAPAIARHDPRAPGVLYGYDFHLGPSGPKLIEINTNAGGALLNVTLAQTERACCDELTQVAAPSSAIFVAMFRREWELFGAPRPLQRIAIVDRDPASQFMRAEFELFRDAFLAAGIDAVIADPSELRLDGNALLHASGRVDLVYNRLTDFYFAQTPVLAAAYLADAALITPHPRGHAIFASKYNLVRLAEAAVLPGVVPFAERVDPSAGDRLWAARKTLFFKPAHGFGSKAAYRGDKLTRATFADILAGDYIAQALVTPSLRAISVDGDIRALKIDVRAYAYEGHVQLFAARLYSGQTTNMRTEGGGFARVCVA